MAHLMQLTGENLTCERGGREVFRDVSFSLKSGEALLVTGRNGAGKSSLLRMIAGLVHMAAGRLALEGGEPEASIAEQSQYVGHQDAVKPSLTVAGQAEIEAGKHLAPAPAESQIIGFELHQARFSLPAAVGKAMPAAEYPDYSAHFLGSSLVNIASSAKRPYKPAVIALT